MHLFLATLAFGLRASAVLIPAKAQNLEQRATTTPVAPACTADSDVVVNGAFYGYPNQPSYAPFQLAPTVGSPGCIYVNGYTPCLGTGGFGAADPDCLCVAMTDVPQWNEVNSKFGDSQCEYGNAGGSDTISQDITFAPGCQYTVE